MKDFIKAKGFTICTYLLLVMATLLVGFVFYGKFTEKIFGPDDRQTPAISIPRMTTVLTVRSSRKQILRSTVPDLLMSNQPDTASSARMTSWSQAVLLP